LRSVQQADLILVMKDGHIIEMGQHEELLSRNGLYKELYGLQFKPQEASGEVFPVLSESIQPVDNSQTYTKPEKEKEGKHLSGSLSGSDEIVYGRTYDSRVVGRLSGYFKAHPAAIILTIAATLLFAFTSVANPYIIGLAENDYILTGNIQGLNIIVLVLIGIGLLNWVSYYTQIRAEAMLGQSILLTMRNQLFSHLQHLSIRFFNHNEVGRIMSRVQNDVGELGEFLDSGAFWVIGEIFSMVVIVVVLFTMQTSLALITLAVIPPLVLFIIFWQKRARNCFIQVRQAISSVNSALEENISGVRVIQSLSREDLNDRQFEQLNQSNFEVNLKSARVSAIMMPAVEFLMSLAIAGVIMAGGLGVMSGTLLVGTLVAFVLYIQNFFDPIRNLTMEYAQLQIAMASGSRIFELLEVKPEMMDSPDAVKIEKLKGSIRFEHVSFHYSADIPVIRDLNLDIAPGTTVALVGPTGAGKSTILGLIARFYDVTGGRILVDGKDLRNIEQPSYRSQLGLVLQEPFLFSGTIRENIRYGRLSASDEEVQAASRSVGADEFISRLDKGYDTELQERGQNLSMGQRQLISFARAVIANPAILLLDEATASIDSHSEQVIQQSLKWMSSGRTTIIIAHRLSTIIKADHIIVLDGGRVVEEGTHPELLSRNGLYARLYAMSFTSGARRV
jgi:ABC-type multidrug transport system fused ATPase/permease subunit